MKGKMRLRLPKKTLNVYFYTSSVEKLLQARTFFGRRGLSVLHYRGSHEPYDEDYRGGTTSLLRIAVDQIRREFGLNSVFFVEDTSLRIDALSVNGDYPGLQVKEWFSRITFDQLDEELRQRRAGRTCTVKSGIALSLPAYDDPILFHGEMSGTIADSPPSFEQSPQYPWLSPNNFNGWVIPIGTHKRLGEMEFEESIPYDFRIRSFDALISRLKEYEAVLNLSTPQYKRHSGSSRYESQLLPTTAPAICVIGPKCAGKSTFGDYMCQRIKARSFEASRIFSEIKRKERSPKLRQLEALPYLKQKGMDSVSREIVRQLDPSDDAVKIVTGLRTIEELDLLYRGSRSIIVVNVQADARVRFERHIRRSRDKEITAFDDFLKNDEEQRTFGLLRVADEISDIHINNDGSMQDYHARIDDFILRQVISGDFKQQMTEKARFLMENEIVRSLLALRRLGRYSTCEEISAETALAGARVRKYNTNRALKFIPELATRRKKPRELLQYHITTTGRKFLDYLNTRFLVSFER